MIVDACAAACYVLYPQACSFKKKKKEKMYLIEPRNAFKPKILRCPKLIKSFLAAVTGSVIVSLKIFLVCLTLQHYSGSTFVVPRS